jgi:two-component system response regulator HydG
MLVRSLRGKLLLAVSVLVIGSGLLISLLVTQRYSNSIFETMVAQAENMAHAVALEATEKVLINDLVALQKMLDHQMQSSTSLTYLFVVNEDRVLAHTFTQGIPVELIKANSAHTGNQVEFKEIETKKGERFIDIAWPIFEGKGGILRLGFSEKPHRRMVTKLWLQMSGLTLIILLLSLTGTHLFVRRMIRPLSELALATKKIEKGEANVRVQVQGDDEVGRLAASFNHMVDRTEDYTRRLEEQTMELERAYDQTKTFCGIVQEIGALRSLGEIGSFLIGRFQQILKCSHMVLLVFNGSRDTLFALSSTETKILKEPEVIHSITAVLGGLNKVTFSKEMACEPPLVPHDFQNAARQAIIPLKHENQLLGGLVIACPRDCRCNIKEVDAVEMILAQAAGVINRAVLQEEEMAHFQSRLEASTEFNGIIGKDPKMQVIYKLIEDVAPTDATVLIEGESGTGKELVARAIHERSSRSEEPFIVINCSAYPATLLESELFGHEKGAFTGAIRQRTGRFEQANGGTVFLDEIGEIPPSAQIKLLRVLQTQKFERLGGEKTLDVDVRILAATNKDLLQEVKNGQFREDLFYRLNVIPIALPALKKRRNDILLLAQYFLNRFAAQQDKNVKGFNSDAMRLLLDYSWPGNVRELENSIEHATVLAKGERIRISDLPSALHSAFSSPTDVAGAHGTLMETERVLLMDVLEECSWNKKQAAQRLGISRSTLYDKLKKYQIAKPTTH